MIYTTYLRTVGAEKSKIFEAENSPAEWNIREINILLFEKSKSFLILVIIIIREKKK